MNGQHKCATVVGTYKQTFQAAGHKIRSEKSLANEIVAIWSVMQTTLYLNVPNGSAQRTHWLPGRLHEDANVAKWQSKRNEHAKKIIYIHIGHIYVEKHCEHLRK